MNKLYNYLYLLLGCVFVSIFYFFTLKYPICSDDWSYFFVYGTAERVRSLGDVFCSQSVHYMTWGGRFVAHCAVQTFLMLNKEWFNVANALCYAACTGGIAILASYSGKKRLGIWLLALMSLWLLMPHTGSSMFWLTGSFNYLWSSCFFVLFLCCLFSPERNLKYGAILLGLIAGNGHECLAIGGVFALLLYSALTPRRDYLFYVGICSCVVGMLTNVLSPGNMVRLSGSESQESAAMILPYCVSLAKVIWQSMCSLTDISLVSARVLVIITLIVCFRCIKRGERGYVMPFCIAIGAIVTLGLNTVVKVYYPRSFYGFCFFSYMGFIMMLGERGITGMHNRIYASVIIFVLLLNFIEIPRAYEAISSLQEVCSRVKQGVKKKQTVIEGIENWEQLCSCRYVESYGLFDSTLRTNALKRFYGVSAISIHPPTVYAYISRQQARLLQSVVHETEHVTGGWMVTRLQRKPKTVELLIPHVKDFSMCPVLLRTVVEKLFPAKMLRVDASVFCLEGVYFVVCKELQHGESLIVEYSEDDKLTIGHSSQKRRY